MYIDEGEIKELGPHDELLEQKDYITNFICHNMIF